MRNSGVYQYAMECLFYLYMKDSSLYNVNHQTVMGYMDMAYERYEMMSVE